MICAVRDTWCLYGRDQETGTWSQPAGVTFDHIRQDSHGPSHAPSTSVQPTVAVASNTLKRQGELLPLRYPSYAFWGHHGRHRDRIAQWNGLEEMDAMLDNWMTKFSAMGTRAAIFDLWTTYAGPGHDESGHADIFIV